MRALELGASAYIEKPFDDIKTVRERIDKVIEHRRRQQKGQKYLNVIKDRNKDFLDRFGHGGLARGAVVVICSDGLEVGDPELLAEQMARLGRLAYRVVWLNPLKGEPGYEPLARGMYAALPHVDLFASGHNLASLEEVAGRLAEM